jgi:hypothetical protein
MWLIEGTYLGYVVDHASISIANDGAFMRRAVTLSVIQLDNTEL